MSKRPVRFEEAEAELKQIVERLEKGELSLEESLKAFERGVQLARTCQKLLKEAEQKVQILLEENGRETLKPFLEEESDNES